MLKVRIARKITCTFLLTVILFTACQKKAPINELPVYDNMVFSFSIDQLSDFSSLYTSFAPDIEAVKLIDSLTSYWQYNGLKIDSVLYYSADQSDPDADMYIFQCLNQPNATELWTGFIPVESRDSHRIDNTYFWHYPISLSLTYYCYVENGKFYLSSDRRYLERCYVIKNRKRQSISSYLKQQGIQRNVQKGEIEWVIEPKYENPLTTQDQFTYLTLKPEAESLSVKGQESPLQLDLEKQLATRGAVSFEALLTAIPNRYNLIDAFSLGKTIDLDLPNALSFWNENTKLLVGETAAYVFSNYKGEWASATHSLIVALKDKDEMKIAVETLANQQGLLYQENYQTYNIRQIVAEQLIEPLLGDRYPTIRNPYILFLDDFLIFSDDLESLRLWIDFYVGQQTALNSVLEASVTLEVGNRLLLWDNLGNENDFPSIELWWHYLTNDYSNGYIQWKNVNDQWIFSGVLSHDEESKLPARIVWNLQPNTSIIAGPYLIRNPHDEELQYMAIQTADNQLWAYDRNGVEAWKMNLTSPIKQVSSVKWDETDWRILTTDQNQLYYLNTKGIVEQSWQSSIPLTGYFSPIRFGDLGDPHIFLSTKMESIYGLNRSLQPFTGWNPKKVGETSGPIQNWIASKEDYFLWENEEGALTLWTRGGKKAKQWARGALIDFVPYNSRNTLLTLSSTGEFNAWGDSKSFVQLWSHTGARHIFADKNVMATAGKNRIFLQEMTLNESSRLAIPISTDFEADDWQILQSGDKLLFVFHQREAEKAWLLDADGQQVFKTPLPAKAITGYVQDNLFYLVVTFGDQLRVYELVG